MTQRQTDSTQRELEELEVAAEQNIKEDRSRSGPAKKTKIVLFLLFLLFVAVVVTLTAVQEFGKKPPEKLGFAFGPENYAFIAGGFICMLLTLLIETVKYVLMMKNLGGRVSVWAAFETAALGKYYDNITPSGIGGQPFQIYNIHKHGYSAGISAAMPLMAFLTMQFGFVILALLVIAFKGDAVTNLAIRIPAYIGVVTYSLLPIGIIIFTISENTGIFLIRTVIRLGEKLRIVKKPEEAQKTLLKILTDYRASVLLISRKRGLFVLLFVLSFVFQVATCSIPYFVLRAFGGTAPYLEILAMTVFVYCSVTFIPTPGNSGAAEGSFYIVFSRLDPTGLFWSMLIWRFICYYAYILIGFGIYGANGLFAWLRKRNKERTRHGEEQDSFRSV